VLAFGNSCISMRSIAYESWFLMRKSPLNKKRSVAVLAAFTATLGLSGLSAQSAAAVDWHGCTSGALCVWLGPNFTQAPSGIVGGAKMSGTNPSWATFSINNDDESWVNHSSGGNSVSVYNLRNYAGFREVCVRPGTVLAVTSASYRNAGESNRWNAGNVC
jgi:Peptidase inhibitor family I36